MNKFLDVALFEVFPYVTVVIFFLESIRRYRQRRFTFSSLSSQFLEGSQLFLGTVPFHYGIMVVLFGHLIAFLFPRQLLVWNSVPIRGCIAIRMVTIIFPLLCLHSTGSKSVVRAQLRSSRMRSR